MDTGARQSGPLAKPLRAPPGSEVQNCFAGSMVGYTRSRRTHPYSPLYPRPVPKFGGSPGRRGRFFPRVKSLNQHLIVERRAARSNLVRRRGGRPRISIVTSVTPCLPHFAVAANPNDRPKSFSAPTALRKYPTRNRKQFTLLNLSERVCN